MHRYIAFLRGINLGKRRIKMDILRGLFEEMKFTDVETFIASGNVIFTCKIADSKKLETQIETHLKKFLGYEVHTFLRTREKVRAIAALKPFPTSDLDHPENTLHVGFLKEALTVEQTRMFRACRTSTDELYCVGQEFYWLCRIKSHESKIWSTVQMKAARLPSFSMRNMTTVRNIAALYSATAS